MMYAPCLSLNVLVRSSFAQEDDPRVEDREDHVCQIKGCYNFLDPQTPWLMCEVHRLKQQSQAAIPRRGEEASGSSSAQSRPSTSVPGTMEGVHVRIVA